MTITGIERARNCSCPPGPDMHFTGSNAASRCLLCAVTPAASGPSRHTRPCLPLGTGHTPAARSGRFLMLVE